MAGGRAGSRVFGGTERVTAPATASQRAPAREALALRLQALTLTGQTIGSLHPQDGLPMSCRSDLQME